MCFELRSLVNMKNDTKINLNCSIKIPDNLCVFCNDTYLILKSVTGIKFIKLKSKLNICHKTNTLKIKYKFLTNSIYSVKFIKLYVKTLHILLMKHIESLTKKSKQKLKLVGVGFRVNIENYSKSLSILRFKLGYSHQIFIIIPKNITVICPKANKILILGNSIRKVNELTSLIKSYKFPEPYKGKGIFYENELIKLKEGKKV